ncbi:ubiquitin-associated protein 1-like [Salarias fasciatus]|uniref:ubiquitin-associated protein 1-like n=1 Tax=Salarias fasciatus TaxID=181472 RepID=UPI001176DEBB|nr:ubiquitin-associated protein 1-like [Salarias fasciatus]
MDGVPLRTPAVVQAVQEDMAVTVPDYLTTLQDTQYEFSLENWVLTGLQSGFTSQPRHQADPSSSELLPSCPPYWMMLSSPQQSHLDSRHSSDFWELNPRQRSHSLSPTVLCGKPTVSASGEKGEGGSGDEGPAESSQPGLRKAQRSFVPSLLNPPTCLSSLPHQRRKNLRHRSFSVRHMPTQHDGSVERPSHSATASPGHRALSSSSSTKLIRPGSGGSPAALAPWDLSSSGLDSAEELLSALSPEERELLEAITARGYPLHMAILALQRTGHQTPDKVLSYLVACDHLCQLGYSMAQVEEALEMFQNCEAKAEKFLQLLSQFNEMGFQQNTIKEVLLVHENHRERALEELMTRVA